jgi:hypothetical protein
LVIMTDRVYLGPSTGASALTHLAIS